MVFVTDGLLRKTVAVCQSLGRQGVGVSVGSTTRLSPAFFSRYCQSQLVYPSPQQAPAEFVGALLDHLGRNRHDVLIPTDDATLALISQHADEFERVTHVPIPAPEQLRYGLDKGRATMLAEAAGIPHPRTAYPRDADEAAGLAAQMGGPVVIKPRSRSGGRGIVHVAAGEDVAAAWRRAQLDDPEPLLQQCIPDGPRYDVCLLVDRRGRLVASFTQKELRHFPIRDGMSTLQESVWRPDLVERAATLLRILGWYGLAEVEFMEDPTTGQAHFLEINPRFWASVQLAISCGIDFPHLLYRVARGETVPEVHSYPLGRRCRWLLPGDLLHFLANRDRRRMEPSFFEFGGAPTSYDGLYRDDPGATLGVLLSCGHYLFDRDVWGLLARRAAPSRPAAAPAALPALPALPVLSRALPARSRWAA
jgi:predicted ATP-grasp superfamily ATP-dependent carboligase